MKKLLFFFALITSISFLSSCNMDDDEAYSLDKAWIGFGLVDKVAVSETFKVVMDNNDVLYPIANSVNIRDIKNNDRILLNYTILGDKKNSDGTDQYYVKINSYRKILFKGILDITPEIEDSIGNNSVGIEDKWIKNGILNFKLYYYGGNEPHYINLVKKPGPIDITKGPVELELRHNNNDDTGRIPFSAYVSFDLSALKIEGKTSIPFKITAKCFNNRNFEYSGEYKY